MFCPKCGTSIDETSAQFCPNCGSQLSATTSATTKMPQAAAQSSSRKTPALMALFGALAAIVVVAAVAGALLASGVIGGAQQHVVSYEMNGGPTMSPTEVDEGTALTSPSDPQRDGYTFKGWYLDAGLTEKASFPLSVSKDTVLYAKWKATKSASDSGASGTSGNSNVPTIVVVTPNGYSHGSITDYYSGSDYSKYSDSVYLEAKTKSGKTLSGWVTRRSGEYVIPDSSTYTYSMSELRSMGLNGAELCIAWNEPFARLGYNFNNSSLQAYFDSCSWYHNSGKKFDLTSGSAGAKNNSRLRDLASSKGTAAWKSLVDY